MENTNTLRQHIVLGVITLILAAALIILHFIPRPVQIYTMPSDGAGGQVSPSNSQSYVGTSASLVIPELEL